MQDTWGNDTYRIVFIYIVADLSTSVRITQGPYEHHQRVLNDDEQRLHKATTCDGTDTDLHTNAHKPAQHAIKTNATTVLETLVSLEGTPAPDG